MVVSPALASPDDQAGATTTGGGGQAGTSVILTVFCPLTALPVRSAQCYDVGVSLVILLFAVPTQPVVGSEYLSGNSFWSDVDRSILAAVLVRQAGLGAAAGSPKLSAAPLCCVVCCLGDVHCCSTSRHPAPVPHSFSPPVSQRRPSLAENEGSAVDFSCATLLSMTD